MASQSLEICSPPVLAHGRSVTPPKKHGYEANHPKLPTDVDRPMSSEDSHTNDMEGLYRRSDVATDRSGADPQDVAWLEDVLINGDTDVDGSIDQWFHNVMT